MRENQSVYNDNRNAKGKGEATGYRNSVSRYQKYKIQQEGGKFWKMRHFYVNASELIQIRTGLLIYNTLTIASL